MLEIVSSEGASKLIIYITCCGSPSAYIYITTYSFDSSFLMFLKRLLSDILPVLRYLFILICIVSRSCLIAFKGDAIIFLPFIAKSV